MKSLIIVTKFTLMALSAAFTFIAILCIAPFSHAFVQQTIRKVWSRTLLTIVGAKLKLYGQENISTNLLNTMVVANHISWMDTVILLRLVFVRFIGKIEMLRWPMLRTVIKAGDTIFIDRKNKRAIPEVNHHIANLLSKGATIGLYPEGTTSPGHQIMPFKAPLLEAAIMAKSTIIPVVISYRKENNQLATDVTFSRVSWFTTIRNTLKVKNLVINVTILSPVISSNFTSRDALSLHLHELMNTCYMQQQIC